MCLDHLDDLELLVGHCVCKDEFGVGPNDGVPVSLGERGDDLSSENKCMFGTIGGGFDGTQGDRGVAW